MNISFSHKTLLIENFDIRRIGNITRRVIAERFSGYDRVIADVFDCPCSNSVQAIISITHFGGICKK